MESLAFLFLLVLLAWLWKDALETRDRAVQAARVICKKSSFQFLDGTASLKSLKPGGRNGKLLLKRTYTFEYSTDGITRKSGCILMENRNITTILLED